MSIGAVDDELERPGFLAGEEGPSEFAPVGGGPAGIPIVPPAEEGPAAPDDIDALMAKLPPAQAGMSPAADPEAWPPPVPSEAPGMVPPPGSPVVPGSAQPGAPADPATDVIRRRGDLNAQAAERQAQLAHDKAERAVLDQADLQEALDHGNELLSRRQKQHDDALAYYQGQKLHDYYDNPAHSKMQSRLLVAFGGLGAALRSAGGGSAQNDALVGLQKKIDDDMEIQKGNIAHARDSVVMAQAGVNDAKEARAMLLQDMNAKHAATYGALEAQARADLADKGVPAAAIDTDERIIALQNARAAAQRKADDERKKEALLAARTRLAEAQANRIERKGRSGGAGGGGRSDALAAFTAAAVDGKTDVADLARLGLRAGLKPNQVQQEVNRIRGEKLKEGKADNADLGAVDKRAESFKKELYSPKGPATQLERIEAMRATLKNAIDTGDKESAIRVLEEAGGMLSGGKSTKVTVELLEKLKSSRDELSEKWGHYMGDPGATKKFTQRLDQLLGGTAEEKRKEVDQARGRFVEQEMGEHGLAREGKAKERALGHAAALFGGVKNEGGSARYGDGGQAAARPAEPPGPPAPAHPKVIPLANGSRYEMGADGQYHFVK